MAQGKIHDCSQMLLRVFKEDNTKEKCYHAEDFAGLYPVWPIIEFSMAPSGASKDERMNSFSMCIVGIFEEILHVDDMAMFAPLTIINNIPANFIYSKAD
jgi:hypothetical protein